MKGKTEASRPRTKRKKSLFEEQSFKSAKKYILVRHLFLHMRGGKSQVCQSEITRGANKGLRMRGRGEGKPWQNLNKAYVWSISRKTFLLSIMKLLGLAQSIHQGYVNTPTTKNPQRTATLSQTSVPISLALRAAAVGFLGLSLPFAFPKGLFVPPPPTTTTRLSHIYVRNRKEKNGIYVFCPSSKSRKCPSGKRKITEEEEEKRRKMPTKKRRDNSRPRATTKISKLIGFLHHIKAILM